MQNAKCKIRERFYLIRRAGGAPPKIKCKIKNGDAKK